LSYETHTQNGGHTLACYTDWDVDRVSGDDLKSANIQGYILFKIIAKLVYLPFRFVT